SVSPDASPATSTIKGEEEGMPAVILVPGRRSAPDTSRGASMSPPRARRPAIPGLPGLSHDPDALAPGRRILEELDERSDLGLSARPLGQLFGRLRELEPRAIQGF